MRHRHTRNWGLQKLFKGKKNLNMLYGMESAITILKNISRKRVVIFLFPRSVLPGVPTERVTRTLRMRVYVDWLCFLTILALCDGNYFFHSKWPWLISPCVVSLFLVHALEAVMLVIVCSIE